jgi:2-keto-4-pentenoate hydratase/2-oxohepta-3-ene-1,7-dioic acid hydratase in catechol pathway
MRIANHDNRLVLLRRAADGRELGLDVERASGRRFAADPQAVYERWDDFRHWADEVEPGAQPAVTIRRELLGPPVPRPQQVFAIGLNYREHAAESNMTGGAVPPTFTKFPTCLTGPYATVALPRGNVDWEVELVAVIGRTAHRVPVEAAWRHVAGLTVGQDLSERVSQLAPPVPQFSLGKSFPGFGPTGPAVVTPDELPDPDDLVIECALGGEVLQKGRTSQMIFNVPQLVAHLSSVVTLLPGDIIFTGTPSGVGQARTPQRFLTPGGTLLSTIEGVGQIETAFVAA